MATIIDDSSNSTPWKLLSPDSIAAVYDVTAQSLYLWATGNFSSPLAAKFEKDEKFVGGLMFKLIATYRPGQIGPEMQSYVADKFEMVQSEHFPNKTVLVKTTTETQQILVVDTGTVAPN